MLVSFNPAISNNNQSKAQSFKCNWATNPITEPVKYMKHLSSENEAMRLASLIENGKVTKTPENVNALNATINKFVKERSLAIVRYLSDARKLWQPLK